MRLEGTWYVLAAHFPMWTKGRRTQPRFIYSNPRTVEVQECFDDSFGEKLTAPAACAPISNVMEWPMVKAVRAEEFSQFAVGFTSIDPSCR